MGDPAGIGPEVIAKALMGTVIRRVCSPLVIGSSDVMQQTVKRLKLKLSVRVVKGHEPMGRRPGEIAVLDPLERPLTRYQSGVAAPETGAFAGAATEGVFGVALFVVARREDPTVAPAST